MAPITKDGLEAAWRRAVGSYSLTPRDRKGLEGIFNYITHVTAVTVHHTRAKNSIVDHIWTLFGLVLAGLGAYFLWLVIDVLLSAVVS